MLWIVSGPSSVGKSTFFESARCREITGLGADAPTLYAFERDLANRDLNNTLFHYNLLRPASSFRRRRAKTVAGWMDKVRRLIGREELSKRGLQELRKAARAFHQDAAWTAVRQNPVQKKAIVLLGDHARILERVRQRREVERGILGGKSKIYKTEEWLWLYQRLDLTELYLAWCAELQAAGIEYLTIDSNDLDFRICAAP